MVQKKYSKMHPVSYTNTPHDVTDLVNYGMVKNTKTLISWGRNLIYDDYFLKLSFESGGNL